LPYLWLKQGSSIWLLIPAILSLEIFGWLITLYPNAVGRINAAYGGMYIGVAITWLWLVQSIKPGLTDLAGVVVCLIGVSIIMLGAKSTQ
jgi:small multidrug resistance family-3 protein